ncbi:MAG: dihydrolipoamide acetyltransferase family protein [bacterium]|nr:dihydrolipoamide acetyltransferase family protein [bacterium]
MAENIIMPQLGESIAEGTIVKWFKKPGDTVKKDENVLLISTDKVEAEIPSPLTGVLITIAVGPGETVAVGTVLGQVGQANETATVKSEKIVSNPQTKSAPAKKEEVPTPAFTMSPTEVPNLISDYKELPAHSSASNDSLNPGFLSPLVKRISTENKVSHDELCHISGSGRDNRITKKDIITYLDNRPAINTNTSISSRQSTAANYGSKTPQVQFAAGQDEIIKPMSTMRKVIMENMIASQNASAHVTTFFEIDYTQIDQIRNHHKERFKQEEQVALTYTTFLTAAVCATLKKHPYINAEIKGNQICFKKHINLGIAVAIEGPDPGLMVPVIKNAEQMNLRGLAHAISDLANRTRTKKIKPDELSGGSFTITNPGNYGAIIGTPIINQPQLAILGVGQIKKQAVVIEVNGTDCIGIRNMGWLSLSFDHRLIDGATADMFMADLKSTLENWSTVP